jgi:DNA-binding SARP family transcriptional activator/TolB-like protein
MDHGPFQLHLLGPTDFTGTGADPDDPNLRPPKRLALLAYLALETAGGFRRRDQIVALFWPDLGQEAARAQLRKALFALREGLGPDAIVTRGETEVRLDPARIWCDAVALGQHLNARRWAEALALYRGDLLEGLFPEGVAPEFEEWLADRRKALREQAAVAAWECSRAEEERGDRKAAAVMARRALALTPDDEHGVRYLMSLLDRHGDRGGALRVYADWQARLQAEYGVEPAPETRKLARKVQAARKGESHETPPTQHPVAVPDGLAVPNGAAVTPPARRVWPLALGSAVLVAAVGAGALMSRAPSGGLAVPSPSSVAIMPIRAIGDPDLAAAADALSEELTTSLVLVPGLVVRPAARTRAAAAENGEADQLGRRLRVAYLVDGGVQRGGGRLRITLRLVRAGDGVAVWAGVYDAEQGDRMTLLRRAATEAAEAVRARLMVPVSTGDSASPDSAH